MGWALRTSINGNCPATLQQGYEDLIMAPCIDPTRRARCLHDRIKTFRCSLHKLDVLPTAAINGARTHDVLPERGVVLSARGSDPLQPKRANSKSANLWKVLREAYIPSSVRRSFLSIRPYQQLARQQTKPNIVCTSSHGRRHNKSRLGHLVTRKQG